MNEKKQNPFADPTKKRVSNNKTFELTDVYEKTQTFFSSKLFKAGGRIGRLQYISLAFGAIFIGAVLGLISFLIPIIGYLLAALLLIVTYIAVAILTIKRCHDFNLHTLIALALLILFPISVLIFSIIPGNEEENKFGVPPPENSTAVVVFAVLFPILYALILFVLISFIFSIPF